MANVNLHLHRGVLYFQTVESALACAEAHGLGHLFRIAESPRGWPLQRMSQPQCEGVFVSDPVPGAIIGPADLTRARRRIADAATLDLRLRWAWGIKAKRK